MASCVHEWPPPTFQPIWLACKACRHQWDDWQPIGVRVETYTAHLLTFRCPKCSGGSDVVTLRSTPLCTK